MATELDLEAVATRIEGVERAVSDLTTVLGAVAASLSVTKECAPLRRPNMVVVDHDAMKAIADEATELAISALSVIDGPAKVGVAELVAAWEALADRHRSHFPDTDEGGEVAEQNRPEALDDACVVLDEIAGLIQGNILSGRIDEIRAKYAPQS